MSSYYYQEQPSFAGSAGRPVTYAVQRLILANIIVFAVQLVVAIPLAVLDVAPPGMSMAVSALSPEYWLGFNARLFMLGAVWQVLTYMFLHGGLLHLFFNMLTLYFFGPDVERILSTRQFFRFYLLCGAVGVMADFALSLATGRSVPSIGASGAVLGVLAAFATAYPKREIHLFPLPIPLYAWAVAALFFLFSLSASGGGTAWATHAGGMVFGFVYMKVTPGIRRWFERRTQRRPQRSDTTDSIGDAVDNIFRFDEEKRRRK